VGSHPALAAVAGSIGLDASTALAYLSSAAGTEEVESDMALARQLAISSVPTFVVEGRYAVQGAQEASVLRTALQEIARREAAEAAR
jgi:predicted DsbA family dithiol-disulfide isomerase